MTKEQILRIGVKFTKDIDCLGFDTRINTVLRRYGYNTVGDVVSLLINGELQKLRNIGKRSIYEVEFLLEKYLGEFFEEIQHAEKEVNK